MSKFTYKVDVLDEIMWLPIPTTTERIDFKCGDCGKDTYFVIPDEIENPHSAMVFIAECHHCHEPKAYRLDIKITNNYVSLKFGEPVFLVSENIIPGMGVAVQIEIAGKWQNADFDNDYGFFDDDGNLVRDEATRWRHTG